MDVAATTREAKDFASLWEEQISTEREREGAAHGPTCLWAEMSSATLSRSYLSENVVANERAAGLFESSCFGLASA